MPNYSVARKSPLGILMRELYALKAKKFHYMKKHDPRYKSLIIFLNRSIKEKTALFNMHIETQ